MVSINVNREGRVANEFVVVLPQTIVCGTCEVIKEYCIHSMLQAQAER